MLEIKQIHHPTYSVVVLSGRLDAVTSSELDLVLQATENAKKNSVILNMASVDYLSSAGLRSMLGSTKRQATKQKKLIICNLTPAVMDIIHIAGFDQIFTLAPSLDIAITLI